MLGCSADNSTNRFFSGKMDEVRVWNKKRLERRYIQQHEYLFPVPEEGLLAYYKCNQGLAYANNSAFTTLTDATAAGNNGTLHGFALSGYRLQLGGTPLHIKTYGTARRFTLGYAQNSGTVAITSNTVKA